VTVVDTDRLSLLVEARDRLVLAMNAELSCRVCAKGVDPPLAGVVRELRAVLLEIDQMPGSGEVMPLDNLAGGIADDLAKRRAAREAG
jgi:hypothetical protein